MADGSDIGKLRDLLAKATPGPWIDPPSRETPPGASCPYLASKDGEGEVLVGRFDYCSEFDKPLIAALRNEVPALLDEIERLRAQAPGWRADMENAPQDQGGPKFVARRANGGMFFADAMLGADRARDISTSIWCEVAAWYPLPLPSPPAEGGK